MRIFIAGATGVLGRRLISQFNEHGHSVVGLVRSAKGEGVVRSLGGEPHWADLFSADSLARAAEGCEVVIHAATAIPAKRRTVPADWAMNDRIRREGIAALTEAASKIGAKTYLQQSVVWVANPQDGSPFDEDSPTVRNPTLDSAIEGETIAREAGARNGFVVNVLRCGAFYDAESAHTRMLGEALRKRALPIIGSGDVLWAMIHTDDAASAFVAAAEQPKNGVWHIVDNELVAVRDLLTVFAAKLGARPPRRVPAWLARLIAGEQAVTYFTRTTRTTNARFRSNFGWTPRYPTYYEGLDQIVGAWKAGSLPHAAA